ncbi:hypothetical protein [Emticicia fontis]
MIHPEIISYIVVYYSHLFTELERKAMRHYQTAFKLDFNLSDSSPRVQLYFKNGWLSNDPQVLDLLKDGYEAFEFNVVKRVMSQTPEKVYFNNCPKCGQLARTPYARQCRCGHQWRDKIVAQFLLDDAFQITGRPFFIVGKILEGRIDKGNYIDLRRIGINRKPIIEAVEIVTKRREGIAEAYIALGIKDPSEDEKDLIKRKDFRIKPLDIVNER